ncbi:MAG: acetylornithine deacetylase [Rhodothalassiaceae bacterium]
MPTAEVLDLIRSLIAFPTVSRDSNMALIAFVQDHLARHGVVSRLFPDAMGAKANLLASIGPLDRPGILLSGHSDVVPVEGQSWSRDPFRAEIDGGRLHGRGACDMKGFLGLMLALVPILVEKRLKAPVHLAFSYDEEVGCAGVRSLADHLAHLETKPAFALIGEPTEMRIVTAHKGIEVVRTEIRGRAGHSSLPEAGANALLAMGEFLVFLEGLAEELAKAPRDDRFDPPYSSLNPGTLSGGNAVNIVAEHAVLEWEFRPLPDVDPEAILGKAIDFAQRRLLPKLKSRAPESGIRFTRIASAPALSGADNGDAETLMRRLIGANESHAVSFTTEAGIFETMSGIPAIVCGPGSIAQAHKADEYVTLDQLDRAARMLGALADLAERGL